MTLPLRLGEYTGYRCWRVIYDFASDPMLISVTTNYVWPSQEPAYGHIHQHSTAGVYAWRSLRRAVGYWLGESVLEPSIIHVLGRVELFGEIATHRAGYRAEHARIVALYTPPWARDLTRHRVSTAAERYGAEVERLSWLRLLAGLFDIEPLVIGLIFAGLIAAAGICMLGLYLAVKYLGAFL